MGIAWGGGQGTSNSLWEAPQSFRYQICDRSFSKCSVPFAFLLGWNLYFFRDTSQGLRCWNPTSFCSLELGSSKALLKSLKCTGKAGGTDPSAPSRLTPNSPPPFSNNKIPLCVQGKASTGKRCCARNATPLPKGEH